MVNAGELFAGAAVGGALGPLFDVIREVLEKTFEFNPTLKSVKSTVDSLASLIPKIEGHNNALGGNRAGEVEELKEIMAEGKKLIDELVVVNEWSCLKAHYTNQLVELDESLKRHLQMLQVQGVIDVKEGLGVAKDTSKDVKEGLVVTKDTSKDVKEGLVVTKDTSKDVKEGLVVTKDTSKDVKEGLIVTKENNNQLVRLEETLKAEFSNLHKGIRGLIDDKMIDKMKWMIEQHGLENKVGSLLEAAALGASLHELYSAVCVETDYYGYRSFTYIEQTVQWTRDIFELIEVKRAEKMSYIGTEELRDFRVEIDKGVELVRNCTKVLEWTDDLESEYTNKFQHLEKTLERLYNRLNGIHPFKWNTAKCGGSSCRSGTTSMRPSVIIED